MKNNHGFTLLEVIFTLTIWSILIVITVPIIMTSLDNHTEKEFFDTLMSDILLIQSMSHGVYKENSSITFNEVTYVIEFHSEKKKVIRHYPKGWKTDGRTFNNISFKNGTIRKAGTILFQADDANYRIIFPFGKGRGYVEKQ